VLLSALFIALTWFAEGDPDHVLARFAQGPGAHLPNLLFFPLGIGLAAVWQMGRVRWQRTVLILGLIGVAGYHLLVAPAIQEEAAVAGKDLTALEALMDRPHGRILSDRMFIVDGRFGSTYDLKWLAHGAGLREAPPERFTKRRSYWNKKLALMPYLICWMCVTFGLAWLPFWSRIGSFSRCANPLSILGRHALMLYLFHLAVIAAAVALLGGGRAGPWTTLLAILGLVSLSVGVALAREWYRGRQGRI
jgi:uncharacterized membrane protein